MPLDPAAHPSASAAPALAADSAALRPRSAGHALPRRPAPLRSGLGHLGGHLRQGVCARRSGQNSSEYQRYSRMQGNKNSHNIQIFLDLVLLIITMLFIIELLVS